MDKICVDCMDHTKDELKKLGIETAEQLNAAIRAEKPLDIGIMTSEVAKEQKAAS